MTMSMADDVTPWLGERHGRTRPLPTRAVFLQGDAGAVVLPGRADRGAYLRHQLGGVGLNARGCRPAAAPSACRSSSRPGRQPSSTSWEGRRR